MNGAIQLVNEQSGNAGIGDGEVLAVNSRPWTDEARWSMRQVIAACLWSALFGLGCGYAWLLIHIGGAMCQ